ncbi:hypothetical protein [uncultured Dokdonia sp.]|uniref:hypothetical protein n=1 Tax=uncultured Dokdonia sp. TaxID=575653 RepID=UPI0026020116|nr:hypothetical protein [uncultured Dokdonia sp.]
MSVGAEISRTLVNAPLPQLIEQLGVSIANAQAALDTNSIRLANAMSANKVAVGDQEYSLIALGFAPTFYQFTEATVEVKLEFSLSESESFSIGGSIGGSTSPKDGEKKQTMFSASLTASYARKFEMSAEGASSIAARIVAIPAPDTYHELLKELAANT